MKKVFSLIALLLAVLFVFAACTNNSADTETTTAAVEKHLDYEVVDANGNTETFHINTTKETVGEALQEAGVLAGTEGDYGLYITSVNGIIADYSIDGTYWAFYVNDEYAAKGVDQTPIVEGEVYSFRVEKG